MSNSIKIKFNKSTNKNISIDFILSGASTSLANGLRRILLLETPIVSFDEKNIKINKNNSSLHNEFLQHRISMIPIDNHPFSISTHYDFSKNERIFLFNKEVNEFVLKYKNDKKINESDNYLEITSNDFKINDKKATEYFKPDPLFLPEKEYIILTYLKANKNEGEEIDIVCKPVIGFGNNPDNGACFNPTGTVSYSFVKEDNDVLEIKKKEYIEYLENERKLKDLSPISEEEKINIKKDFDMLESDRIFKKNKYNFKIESVGNLYPYEILINGIIMFQLKLIDLLSNIKYNKNRFEFMNNINLYKEDEYYKIHIKNENHTLGNVICEYLNKIYNDTFIDSCSYKIIHPLKNEILLKIKLFDNLDQLTDEEKLFCYDENYNISYNEDSKNYIIYIFEYSIIQILKDLNKLKELVSNEYKINYTFNIDKYDLLKNIIDIKQ